jgi:hypothetical protein
MNTLSEFTNLADVNAVGHSFTELAGIPAMRQETERKAGSMLPVALFLFFFMT